MKNWLKIKKQRDKKKRNTLLCSWGAGDYRNLLKSLIPFRLNPQISTCIQRMNKHFVWPITNFQLCQAPTNFFLFIYTNTDFFKERPFSGSPKLVATLHMQMIPRWNFHFSTQKIFIVIKNLLPTNTSAVLITIQPTNFKHNSAFGCEGVDSDPEKRENRGEQDRPHDNNGGKPVLSSHHTLEERVEMHDHPQGKEKPTKERSPWFITIVNGIRHANYDPNHIYDEQCHGWDQKGCPFEQVELGEVSIIGCFGCDSEVSVDTSKYF